MSNYFKPMAIILGLLLIFPGIFSCGGGSSKKSDQAFKLDVIIENYLEQNNIPSAEVLVTRNGQTEYHRAFGFSDLFLGDLRQTDQPFRIASISKTFTALRILQMHDETLVDLDDPVSGFFPDFPNSDIITIRHLLNMNAGIPDFADHRFLEEWHDDPFMEFSMEKAVEMSAEKADFFKNPGQEVIYSNINYTLLGLIIEQASNNSVQNEFNDNIFSELNLESTLYTSNTFLPGRLRGYSWDSTREIFIDITDLNPVVPNTGGAVISTMSDLRIFGEALYKGTLLSQETHWEQMKALSFSEGPEWIRYGLGILDMGGFWGHNGTIFGFSSEMYYFPPEDAMIIINVNRSDKDDKSHSFALFNEVSKLLFPDDVKWN